MPPVPPPDANSLATQPPCPRPSGRGGDYPSGKVEFAGRADELRRLAEFCRSDAPVSWWAVTGVGGSGKSRLACELGRSLAEEGWDVRFLPASFFDHSPAWDGGSQPRDLLVVVDGAQFRAQAIGRWLDELIRQPGTRRCRVLFLEQEGFTPAAELSPPPWWQQILAAGDHSRLRQAWHASRSPAVSLDERFLSQAAMQRILASVGVTGEQSDAVIDRLATIDPYNRRPLYLLLLGQAALTAGDTAAWRSWDLADLLDSVYDHEDGLMAEAGLADTAWDRWVFAAATGPNPPDIPGEYLVLRRLANFGPGSQRLADFLASAWRAPNPFRAFLQRAWTDFGQPPDFEDRPDFRDLFSLHDGLLQPPAAEAARPDYAALLTALTRHQLAESGEPPLLDCLVDKLRHLHRQRPSLDTALPLAMGLVNATVKARPTDDCGLDELRWLYRQYPDPGIARQLAKALFNKAVKFNPKSDPEAWAASLDELRDLHHRHHDLDTALPLALGLCLMAVPADQARRALLLGELRGLHRRHPDPDIALPLAFGLVSSTFDADRRHSAALVGELRDLHRQHLNPSIALHLAKGLVNAAAPTNQADHTASSGRLRGGRHRSLTEARGAFVSQLRDLHRQHPDPDIALRLAMALANSAIGAGPADRAALASELRDLHRHHPDPGIALLWAKVLFNTAIAADQLDQAALAVGLGDPQRERPSIPLRPATGLSAWLAKPDPTGVLAPLAELANRVMADPEIRHRFVPRLRDSVGSEDEALLQSVRQTAHGQLRSDHPLVALLDQI
ncbi:MAG: hypothetical protein LBH76_00520 [Propionibacteriaceae bacterium]|jgi:hypothetical protein|nr:hypothetical protein [Propionibacteriaceae bacterium]